MKLQALAQPLRPLLRFTLGRRDFRASSTEHVKSDTSEAEVAPESYNNEGRTPRRQTTQSSPQLPRLTESSGTKRCNANTSDLKLHSSRRTPGKRWQSTRD